MMMFHPGPGTRVTASIFESQIVGAFWVQKRYGTWPSKWSRTCSSIVVSWRNSRLGCKTTSPVVLLAFVSNSCLQSLRLDTFKWRRYFLPIYDFHLRHLESLGQHPGRHCATWSTRLRRWYLESKPQLVIEHNSHWQSTSPTCPKTI